MAELFLSLILPFAYHLEILTYLVIYFTAELERAFIRLGGMSSCQAMPSKYFKDKI